MELARQAPEFRARGIELAAVVPEPVPVLKAFAERMSIPYALLSDPDSRVIRSFGLVDDRHPKDNPDAADLPYAGNLLLDPDRTVRGRFFEEAVEIRRTAGSILVYQGGTGTSPAESPLDHFVLRTSASNAELMPGQRFTLLLDLEVQPRHHVYAPGTAGGYRPLRLVLDDDALYEVHPPQYPPARSYFFAPLKETVGVYEGRFRLLQDVTLRFRPALGRLGPAPETEAALLGRLEYQVCSDAVCYPPGSTPVRWTFRIRRWIK